MRELAAIAVWSGATWFEFWGLTPGSLWHFVTWPVAGVATLYGAVSLGRRLFR